jgi:hypothetical protein
MAEAKIYPNDNSVGFGACNFDLYFSSPLLIPSQNRYITPLGFIVIIVCKLLGTRVRMLANLL